MEEIRALGGDESDLQLIKDVDSDSEDYVQDSKKPADKSLKDELAAFSKQLGLADYAPSEASEEEEDVQEEDADDDEEEDEEESEEDEEEDPPLKVGNQVG